MGFNGARAFPVIGGGDTAAARAMTMGRGLLPCCHAGEDTGGMDRERAEAHLRLLAEAELRRVTAMPAGSVPGRWYSPSLTLVAQALTAADAVSPGIADEIQDDIGLAVAGRHRLIPRNPRPGTHPAGAPADIMADSAGRSGGRDPGRRPAPRGACRGVRAVRGPHAVHRARMAVWHRHLRHG